MFVKIRHLVFVGIESSNSVASSSEGGPTIPPLAPTSPICTRKFTGGTGTGIGMDKEVSVDTPMHRQLRRHLQHYLRPQEKPASLFLDDE